MTSVSHQIITVRVFFFGDAAAIYGDDGLEPATAGAVGVDLRACLPQGEPVTIAPGERRMIPTGIAIEADPPGIAGFVYSRSGLGAVRGLTVAQGVGVIDPDYRGEIMVSLLNTGQEPYTVQPGERIAQLLFQPCLRPSFLPVKALGETERGPGGFGHTGSA